MGANRDVAQAAFDRHGTSTRFMDDRSSFRSSLSPEVQHSLRDLARGMLSDWSLRHRSIKKRVALWLYQYRDLRLGKALLTTSVEEQESVRRFLGGKCRVEMIPNGCAFPPQQSSIEDLRILRQKSSRLMIAMGRLHSVKQFDRLIKAWALVRPSGWRLEIIGPCERGLQQGPSSAH